LAVVRREVLGVEGYFLARELRMNGSIRVNHSNYVPESESPPPLNNTRIAIPTSLLLGCGFWLRFRFTHRGSLGC
jgi:hypothetical protein